MFNKWKEYSHIIFRSDLGKIVNDITRVRVEQEHLTSLVNGVVQSLHGDMNLLQHSLDHTVGLIINDRAYYKTALQKIQHEIKTGSDKYSILTNIDIIATDAIGKFQE